jgi:hypothetical protein
VPFTVELHPQEGVPFVEFHATDAAGNRVTHVVRVGDTEPLLPPERPRRLAARGENHALETDGRSALRLALPDGGRLPRRFTLECWCRGTAWTKDRGQVVLGKCDRSGAGLFWRLFGEDGLVPPQMRIGAVLRDAAEGVGYTRAAIPNEEPPDERWRHLAMTYEGKQLVFFLDGERVADTSSAGITDNGRDLHVGADPGMFVDPELHFTGFIDDVRLSSTVRYRGKFKPPGRVIYDDDTVVLLDFEESVGTHPVVMAKKPFFAQKVGEPRVVEYPR